MEKEFVPYDRALRLKEIGFDDPCFGFYDDVDKGFNQIHSMASVNGEQYSKLKITKAPTFSQAFRWFREKYDIISVIYRVGNDYVFGFDTIGAFNNNSTYEEAELACLDKLIEIVELNQNKDEKD